MRSRIVIAALVLIVLNTGCRQKIDCGQVLVRMQKAFDSGMYSSLGPMSDSVRKGCGTDFSQIGKADSIFEIARRVTLDFSLDENQFFEKLKTKTADFTNEDLQTWYKNGWIEYKMIDGKRKYFNRAASNLDLLRKFHGDKDLILKDKQNDPELQARLKHTAGVLDLSTGKSNPVSPVSVEITYKITVAADAVPDGEVIRCWMPWPKSGHARQDSVKLISTSENDYSISPDTAIHSSLYMQHKAQKGKASEFSITFSYRTFAQHFNLKSSDIKPYNRESELYKKYTAQQLPQINFSEAVRHLADSLTAGETNPVDIARNLYMWFKSEIPWAGALEYSTMPDIPGYVLNNRHGDCGMQTLLYMSMLRYMGIPVRWQSGWMIPPGYENLHDWCEIYFEGPGWVPSDASYDLQVSDNKDLKEYYFSGLDSYRMVVNDGISGSFYPTKKFMRSEPYDFQRGELEWSGGNLYFDKWDYEISINYIKQ
jgi:hypothetical protein